ncbi:acyl-CoA-binding domain-containing protein 5-like isoform X2 [Physella acuta]|uniref:acyl-CoA-binding domain-containing protein 5-like isoform X2 n=1 Tax=Physella acuta TaxID=109671 RepID=UPI0027DE0567|nr:acyl-CoA-binding domain-containing protein 5-like isoform X2 [Physella acuta]
MASSPKEKFDAAVKVIRGLPKNGSFQPSHELMLKFYSYYKQATEGPCTSAKPGFWDLVNRKKWEAWSSLGNMDGEKAMLLYVDELKKVSINVRKVYYPPQIVETMPQTNDVSEFLQKLDNFYEMVDEQESFNDNKHVEQAGLNGLIAVMKDVRGEVENLCIEYDNHIVDKNNAGKSGEWEELDNELSNTSIVDASDSETDEFCDTSDEPLESVHLDDTAVVVETSTPVVRNKTVHFDTRPVTYKDSETVICQENSTSFSQVHIEKTSSSQRSNNTNTSPDPSQHQQEDKVVNRILRESKEMTRGTRDAGRHTDMRQANGELPGSSTYHKSHQPVKCCSVNEKMSLTVQRLQQDVKEAQKRIRHLEHKVVANKMWWWPFPELSVKSAVIILLWPVILHLTLRYIQQRHRKQ